jgi:two-component sensor histidine kinase
MKALPILFIIFLFIPKLLLAQNNDQLQKREVDALQLNLSSAKHDSIKLRLNYQLGLLQNIKRISYWDSLNLIAKEFQLLKWEARIDKQLGDLYYFENNGFKANELYEESILKSEACSDKHEKLRLLYQIAYQHIYFNHLKLALKSGFDGLKIAENIGDQEWIGNFNAQIGTIHFHSLETKKALERHIMALSIYKKLNNNHLIVSALCDVASDYGQIHDTINSCKYYLETAKYSKDFGLSRDAIEVNKALNAAYLLKGKIDSAEYFGLKACKMADSMPSITTRASTNFLLAFTYFEGGKYDLAKNSALLALKLCRQSKFILQLPGLYLLLNKLYLREQNYKEAFNIYKSYITIHDSLNNIKLKQETIQQQFDYEFEKKENENLLLIQQNQIQSLELERNYYLLGGLVVLLLFVATIAYLFLRQNKLKANHKSMLLEQKLLQSQMNPHFIFNALQSIQHSILKNDSKTAVKHLNSFASLTRSVLENSRAEYISLGKEIELLNNYLQLQKMRFSNRFDYEINVDEKIDKQRHMIAPMLSQPFLENAIEHGFNDTDNDGKITVDFKVDGQLLMMTISDNGVGIQSHRNEKKSNKSLAITITKDRIGLINKEKNGTASFDITEAFPKVLHRKGVKVCFVLPLIHIDNKTS